METNPTNQTPCQDSACCQGACVPEDVAAEELQTPEHWQTVTGIRIMDPDGWRGEKSFDEPVTLKEFNERAICSTTCGMPRERETEDVFEPVKLPPMQPLSPPPEENTVVVLFIAAPENRLQGFVGVRRDGEYTFAGGDPIPAEYPPIEGWRYLEEEEISDHRDGLNAACEKLHNAYLKLRSVKLSPSSTAGVEAPVDTSEV